MNTNIKQNRSRFIVGMCIIFTFLFFAPVTKIDAMERHENMTFIQNAGNIGQDLPTEVTDPIDKGVSLIVYLVIVAGIIIFLIGLVLLAVTWLGHQQDQLVKGLLALGVGSLLAAGPFIAEWIFGIDIV